MQTNKAVFKTNLLISCPTYQEAEKHKKLLTGHWYSMNIYYKNK